MKSLAEEARELQLAADKGDAEAAFRLVWMYYDTGSGKVIAHDPQKAAALLDRAAELGHMAAKQQILTVLSQDNFPNAEGGIFMKWLENLALSHKVPMYMIELAAIYCGEEGNEYIGKFKCKERDVQRGLRLFEMAIALAEEENSPFICQFYSRAYDAYRTEKNRLGANKAAKADDRPSAYYLLLLKRQAHNALRCAETSQAFAAAHGLPYEFVTNNAKISELAHGELASALQQGDMYANMTKLIEYESEWMKGD